MALSIVFCLPTYDSNFWAKYVLVPSLFTTLAQVCLPVISHEHNYISSNTCLLSISTYAAALGFPACVLHSAPQVSRSHVCPVYPSIIMPPCSHSATCLSCVVYLNADISTLIYNIYRWRSRRRRSFSFVNYSSPINVLLRGGGDCGPNVEGTDEGGREGAAKRARAELLT